jgi:hypothetical protein
MRRLIAAFKAFVQAFRNPPGELPGTVRFGRKRKQAKLLALHRFLLYLDRDYIAGRYEAEFGVTPTALITKTQAGKAGASLAPFSAEVSAGETRAFSLSTLEMFAEVADALNEESDIDLSSLRTGVPSRTGWVNGDLSTARARGLVMKSDGTEKEVATEGYFILIAKNETRFALLTTASYFSSGVDAFPRLQQTMLKEMSIPVRALVRVLAARGHVGEWIAVPLVVLESPGAENTVKKAP